MKGNYAWSNETRSLNYGVSGGILLHSEGVTFSQEMGETVALVKAPGAAGLAVEKQQRCRDGLARLHRKNAAVTL